jgi:hypothetical protein
MQATQPVSNINQNRPPQNSAPLIPGDAAPGSLSVQGDQGSFGVHQGYLFAHGLLADDLNGRIIPNALSDPDWNRGIDSY